MNVKCPETPRRYVTCVLCLVFTCVRILNRKEDDKKYLMLNEIMLKKIVRWH